MPLWLFSYSLAFVGKCQVWKLVRESIMEGKMNHPKNMLIILLAVLFLLIPLTTVTAQNAEVTLLLG